jgi:hypothetical protein
MAGRRFPPPWSVEERPACFIVRDANGQALAYVYYEEEPGRRSAAKLMSLTKRGASPQTSPSYQSCSRNLRKARVTCCTADPGSFGSF